jgi:hypothetical protein
MSDVLYVLLLLGSFAALAGLVRLCDRIIGGDEAVTIGQEPDGGAVGAVDVAPAGAGTGAGAGR